MRLSGRVHRVGRFWAIEVPILGVVTQGRSKRDAFTMIADAIESLADKDGFYIDVLPGKGDYFEVSTSEQGVLMALLLKRERLKAGLTLAQVAERLGIQSVNAYARYEQGRSVPTVQKLTELFAALAPNKDFVLSESRIAQQSL